MSNLALMYDFERQPGLDAVAGFGPTLTSVRASVAKVLNDNSILAEVPANEARFTGARRVENKLFPSVDYDEGSSWDEVVSTGRTTQLRNATGGFADPFGGTDAWLLECSTDADDQRIFSNPISSTLTPKGGSYTASCYLKNNDGDGRMVLRTSVLPDGTTFDLDQGVIERIGTSVESAGISSVGNGWYRCWITVVSLSDKEIFHIVFQEPGVTGGVDGTFDGTTYPKNCYVYSFQVEDVSGQADTSPSEYIPTTTAAVARLYNSRRRTNLCLQSEDFDTTWVDTSNGITTADQAVAPDGETTADKLVDDSSTGTGNVITKQSIGSLSLSITYTISCFFKADGLDWARIQIANLGALTISAYFDLTDGVVGATVGGDNTSEFIEDVGNGWYRCGIIFESDAADNSLNYLIYAAEGNADNTVDLDGTSSIFVWGAQLEQGSVATDYIPTTTAIKSSGFDTRGGQYQQHENICLQSEDFGTTWTNTNGSLATDAAVAPDGLTTADNHVDDSATGTGSVRLWQTITTATSTAYTYSVYCKKNGLDWVLLSITGMAAQVLSAFFDLTNGVVGATVGGDVTSTFIEDVGNGWFRCGFTFTSDAVDTSSVYNIYVAEANNDTNVALDGTSSIFVWGAQVQKGSRATTYTKTTTAAVVGGFWERPLGLLVEEARTNICLRSENLSIQWVNTNTTNLQAQGIAPDGTNTANSLTDDATNSLHRIYQTLAFPATSAVFAVFMKYVDHQWMQLLTSDGTTTAYANYDVLNEVTGNSSSTTVHTIEDIGNGWFKCVIGMASVNAAGTVQIVMLDADIAAPTPSYIGTETTCLIWGAQLEAGAFPTSYIPTVGASVTRNADVVTTSDVSWYDIAATTLYAKASQPHFTGSDDFLVGINDSSSSDYIGIKADNTDERAEIAIRSASSTTSAIYINDALSEGVVSNFALAAASNDSAFYVDGNNGVADSSVTLPVGIDSINIGSLTNTAAWWNGHIAEIRYYNVREDNTFLISASSGVIQDNAGVYYNNGVASAADESVSCILVDGAWQGKSTDVYISGTRHSVNGAMYMTLDFPNPDDPWINGIRHTPDGVRYVQSASTVNKWPEGFSLDPDGRQAIGSAAGFSIRGISRAADGAMFVNF